MRFVTSNTVQSKTIAKGNFVTTVPRIQQIFGMAPSIGSPVEDVFVALEDFAHLGSGRHMFLVLLLGLRLIHVDGGNLLLRAFALRLAALLLLLHVFAITFCPPGTMFGRPAQRFTPLCLALFWR